MLRGPLWFKSVVTVCAESPELGAVVDRAARAWTVGPRLTYVGVCDATAGADIQVFGGGQFEKPEKVAQTSKDTNADEIVGAGIQLRDVIPAYYDRQAIITHELGHAIGLGHTNVARATMFGYVAPLEIGARDIEEEDKRMVRELYGEDDQQ